MLLYYKHRNTTGDWRNIMAYVRKTRDEWEIQGNYGYGHGWECVNTETTWKDAKRSLAEYRANENVPFRLVVKRVKIAQD